MADEPGVGTPQGVEEVGQEPEKPQGEAADGGEQGPDEVAQLKAEVERFKKLHDEHLREKSNLEEERRKIREQVSQPGQTQPSAMPDGIDPDKLAADIPKLREIAREDSEAGSYARVLLAAVQSMQQTTQSFRDEIGILRVPEPERKDVENVVKEARVRGEYITYETARQLLKGQSLAQREEAIAQKERELTEAIEARKRGEISTRIVPAPSALQEAKELTFSDFGKRVDNAKSAAEKDELYRRTHLLSPDDKDYIRLVPG